jgi:hypothetical protein
MRSREEDPFDETAMSVRMIGTETDGSRLRRKGQVEVMLHD